ncbi:MAG: PASTA domain-containing protein, partial [Deinococcus sp.]|nr:PASTA domain-containing protein [Deinococcus sp.]
GALVIVLLACALVLGRQAMAEYLEVPAVRVPAVMGYPLTQAVQLLAEAGLTYQGAEALLDPASGYQRRDLSVPPGTVIAQTPPPGQKVKLGRMVRLTISELSAVVAVPSVVGRTVDQAERLLAEAGLAAGRRTSTHSDAPAQEVIAQEPPAGAVLSKGSTIALLVSQGPWQRFTVVPALEGLTRPAAEAVLRLVGLTMPEAEERYDPTKPLGSVLEQSLPPGTRLSPGTPISLVINQNAGFGWITVPDLEGLSRDQAQQLLEGLGLRAEQTGTERSSRFARNLVLSQTERAGLAVRPGSTVHFVVNDYRGAPPPQTQVTVDYTETAPLGRVTMEILDFNGKRQEDLGALTAGQRVNRQLTVRGEYSIKLLRDGVLVRQFPIGP